MRAMLLAVVATSWLGIADGYATVYQVSFHGGSTFATSIPSAAGVTYNAPSGDNASVTGTFTYNTADTAARTDGKGGTFYPGSTGTLTIAGLVNLPSASYTFSAPRIVLDVKAGTVGSGVSVSLAPGLVGNATDIVWVDGSHFEVKHTEANGGFELNEFSTVITGIAEVVVAVPEPASLLLMLLSSLGLGLARGGVRRAPALR